MLFKIACLSDNDATLLLPGRNHRSLLALGGFSQEELDRYRARRQAIWDQLWKENTRLQELQKDLDENYY